MSRKENPKNKKGISLIVLVITIIVIIILAVAVILSISNNNPIENARKARFLNDLRTIQEEVALHIGKQYVERKGNYKPSEDPDINKILDNYPDYKDSIKITDGKVVFIENENNKQESEWAKENGVTVEEKKEEVVEPVIPVGFSYKEGTVDTGYVIQNDTDKNEFVWVPVEVPEGKTFEEVFVREDGYEKGTLQTYVSSGYSTEPYSYNGQTADANEIAEYEAMYKSVKKYNGFYVARYEASDNGNGVAQSKKDKTSWEITCGIYMANLSGGAVEKARAVYANSDEAEGSKYAVSTLLYEVQWDATVRWIEKSYPGISQDSTDYGNYRNSTFEYINKEGITKTKAQYVSGKIPTGSSEHNKTNNIYDMCGNLVEWTMEACGDNRRTNSGGSYSVSGTDYPVSNRGSNVPDLSLGVGFRLALYIK